MVVYRIIGLEHNNDYLYSFKDILLMKTNQQHFNKEYNKFIEGYEKGKSDMLAQCIVEAKNGIDDGQTEDWNEALHWLVGKLKALARGKCIHTDYDICYCGCPKCEIECTIENQKSKGGKK